MRILIDVPILLHFQQVPAELNQTDKDRHLAAIDKEILARMLILGGLSESLDYDLERLTGRVLDARIQSSFDMVTGQILGYCHPFNEGWEHSLLVLTTKRVVVDPDRLPYDLKLSDFLASAMRRNREVVKVQMAGEKMTFELAPDISTALQAIAVKHKVNLNALVNHILFEYAKDNL